MKNSQNETDQWKYFQDGQFVNEEAMRAGLELFQKRDCLDPTEFCKEFAQFGNDLMGMILASLISIHSNEGNLQEDDLNQVFTMFTGQAALTLVENDNSEEE